MGIKISELPVAGTLARTEPLVQARETRQASVAGIAPVRSVVGKTGAVSLTASDCGAAASSHSHPVPDLNLTGATEIGAALVDTDELPVYDASAAANRKSVMSRIWTYIQSSDSRPLEKFI